MLDIKIPKARLLTIGEVLGVEHPSEFTLEDFQSLYNENTIPCPEIFRIYSFQDLEDRILEEYGGIKYRGIVSKKNLNGSSHLYNRLILTKTSEARAIKCEYIKKLSDLKEDKLDVFKKRGIACTENESRRLWQEHSDEKNEYRVDNLSYDGTVIINGEGIIDCNGDSNCRSMGNRIAFNWSDIKEYCLNINRAEDGVLEADYGLWLGDFAEGFLAEILELLYKNDQPALKKVGLNFTTEGVRVKSFLNGERAEYMEFEPISNPVFEFQGSKYARVTYNYNEYSPKRYRWVTLKPIHLWIDEDRDVAVSEKIEVAGLRAQDMSMYLENYFSTEVFKGALFAKEEQRRMVRGSLSLDESPKVKVYRRKVLEKK